jgi:hypothetical protein
MPNAAAGLYSTTADLLRWQNALYGGRVVSKSALEKMTTPFISDYGLGVYVRTIARRCSAITPEQIAAYQNARIWRGSTLR